MSNKYSFKTCINCGTVKRSNGIKYCSCKCQQDFQYKEKVKLWLDGKLDGRRGKTSTANFVRRYVIESRGHKCECCKNTDWMGQPIPIQLHHKDGRFENNGLDNLELLCANCHLQTPNFGSKNEFGRKFRKKYWTDVDG